MRKYNLKCRDTGAECDFEIRNAASKEELLMEMDVHAKHRHGFSMNDLTSEQVEALTSKITVVE